MSVGILLITHVGIGDALLNVAQGTFGHLPLTILHLSVCGNPDPDSLVVKAAAMVQKLNQDQGVMVLTDMFGSTPSNVAQGLLQTGHNVRVVSGLNLPMLIKVLNYPHLTLTELTDKAVSAGKEGIFEPVANIPQKKKSPFRTRP